MLHGALPEPADHHADSGISRVFRIFAIVFQETSNDASITATIRSSWRGQVSLDAGFTLEFATFVPSYAARDVFCVHVAAMAFDMTPVW